MFFLCYYSWGFGDLDVGVTGLSQVVGGLWGGWGPPEVSGPGEPWSEMGLSRPRWRSRGIWGPGFGSPLVPRDWFWCLTICINSISCARAAAAAVWAASNIAMCWCMLWLVSSGTPAPGATRGLIRAWPPAPGGVGCDGADGVAGAVVAHPAAVVVVEDVIS